MRNRSYASKNHAQSIIHPVQAAAIPYHPIWRQNPNTPLAQDRPKLSFAYEVLTISRLLHYCRNFETAPSASCVALCPCSILGCGWRGVSSREQFSP